MSLDAPPPDATPPVLSRRGLGIAAISGLILVVAVVVMGLTTRKMADARLSEWTEDQAVPTVAIAKLDSRDPHDHRRSAGPARSLFAGPALCPRQRLPQGLEGRHRHAG